MHGNGSHMIFNRFAVLLAGLLLTAAGAEAQDRPEPQSQPLGG